MQIINLIIVYVCTLHIPLIEVYFKANQTVCKKKLLHVSMEISIFRISG